MKIASLVAAIALSLMAPAAFAQGVYEGQIDGDFNGWEGETVYKLMDGRIIQQSSYHYHYHYSYSPTVIICRSSRGLMIKVDGVSGPDVSIVFLK